MRRLVTALAFAVAALVAAVAVFVGFTLPRAAATLTTLLQATTVLGAYHVHSSRSDGTGTVDQIAAAAGRAGLQFVILTDHGDLTRTPDPPAYRHGVLCLDGAEISTFDGHVVALNVQRAAPYPLAGEGRDVIEDIHRLGGWAVIAHPDSPRPELRWRAPNVPYDGLEWVNADSEWRDEPARRLLAVAVRSILRPAESVASLFERPARTLQRWDAALRTRPVLALAAVDAHASLPWSEKEEPRRRAALAWPSYEAMFGVLAQAVVLDRPLSSDAAADAVRVWSALGAGRTFAITRAIAGPATLLFDAERDGAVTAMGGTVDATPAVLRATVPGVPSARLVLLRDGQQVITGQGSVTLASADPGAYRVEVFYPGAAFPWMVSNAIRVGGADAPVTPSDADGVAPKRAIVLGPDTSRHVEHDPASTASFEVTEGAVRFEFGLGSGPPAGQYVAVTSDVSGEDGIDRVSFTARASRPMRLSLQVRLGGGGSVRWRRSFYVDETPRAVVIRLRDLEPIEGASTLRPIVARVQAVLVVTDTLNTAPGTTGTVWLSDMKLGIGETAAKNQ